MVCSHTWPSGEGEGVAVGLGDADAVGCKAGVGDGTGVAGGALLGRGSSTLTAVNCERPPTPAPMSAAIATAKIAIRRCPLTEQILHAGAIIAPEHAEGNL
jgi:hypothetical protein